MPPRPPILVLDGDERASLAVTRSLVRAGYPVHVTAARRRSLAGSSRGAVGHVLQSRALAAPEAYAREVAALAARLGVVMVIPVTDASAESVVGNAVLMPAGVRLPFASYETYREASDKVRVHELALENGIGIAETAVVRAKGDPLPEAPGLYPGFLKPHRSVVGLTQRQKTEVQLVADCEAAARALARLHPDAFPVMIQRRVTGAGEGIFLARWGGRTIARFAHRRIREKPPAGGVSVFRESIAADPLALAGCERLLDALKWQGVAMIEGKRDDERGGWRVMEINGRFWGSLQLAIDAGVDFPAMLVAGVLGEPEQPLPAWRAGVRLRWEWGDVDHLLIRLRRSREALQLPPSTPTRLGALAAFLCHSPGRDRLEVFRWSDPMPFVVESLTRAGI